MLLAAWVAALLVLWTSAGTDAVSAEPSAPGPLGAFAPSEGGSEGGHRSVADATVRFPGGRGREQTGNDSGTCYIERVYRNDTVDIYSPAVSDVNGKELLEMVKRNKNQAVVLLVYAKWCPFSAKFEPIFKYVANSFPRRNVTFLKVDGESDQKFLTQTLIRGYPSIAIFSNGKPLVFYEGEKTFDRVTRFISETTNVVPRAIRMKAVPKPKLPESSFDWALAFSLLYIGGSMLFYPIGKVFR